MAGISLFNADLRSLYSISIVVFGFNCHVSEGYFTLIEPTP
jgi:hypothetical protein